MINLRIQISKNAAGLLEAEFTCPPQIVTPKEKLLVDALLESFNDTLTAFAQLPGHAEVAKETTGFTVPINGRPERS